MNLIWIASYILVGYVAILLATEVLVWRVQPAMDGGVRLAIRSDDGEQIERTVYGHIFDGTLYVSSNHWFRSWYRAALKNPEIDVIRDGESQPYRASVVVGEEHSRVLQSYNMGFFLRLLCGFAPSKFLRLEPIE